MRLAHTGSGLGWARIEILGGHVLDSGVCVDRKGRSRAAAIQIGGTSCKCH